jgi:hypothetical protein
MTENGRQKKGEAAFIVAIASGRTIRDAAKLSGLSERTAARRIRDPDVAENVRRCQAILLDQVIGQLVEGQVEAARCLRELLKSERESVRLHAAKSLLDIGMRCCGGIRAPDLYDGKRRAMEKQPTHGVADWLKELMLEKVSDPSGTGESWVPPIVAPP